MNKPPQVPKPRARRLNDILRGRKSGRMKDPRVTSRQQQKVDLKREKNNAD